MSDLGKIMIIAGLVLAGVGLLLVLGGGKIWPGRMPGDIHVTRGSFSFHFPLVTCLVISAVLTLVFWLFRR